MSRGAWLLPPSSNVVITSTARGQVSWLFYSARGNESGLQVCRTMPRLKVPFSPSASGGLYGSDCLQCLGGFTLGYGEFILVLQVHPALGIRASQGQRGLGGRLLAAMLPLHRTQPGKSGDGDAPRARRTHCSRPMSGICPSAEAPSSGVMLTGHFSVINWTETRFMKYGRRGKQARRLAMIGFVPRSRRP